MIRNTVQNNQISFQGIKSRVRLGESAIREFHQQFPNIKSSSKLALRLQHSRETLKENKLFFRIKLIIDKQYRKNRFMIDELNYQAQEISRRRKSNGETVSFPSEEFLGHVTNMVTTFNSVLCGDMALLTQKILAKKGVKAECVSRDLIPKIDAPKNSVKPLLEDHEFLLVDASSHAKLDKPATWGSKAVIVDPWLGEAKPAHEMLKRYDTLFGVDCDSFGIRFKDRNIEV